MHKTWRGLAALLLAGMLATAAQARDFKVEPGELPALLPGEGLLVVGVDSDTAVRALGFRHLDKLFSGDSLRGIGVGRTSGLYVVPAGRYRWDRLDAGWVSFRFKGEKEYEFEVREGRINYAGDVIYRDFGRFHLANRGLRALDWLEDAHAGLLARHGFEYSGHYPDPFPGFYLAERKAHPAPAREDATRMPPAPGPLPIAVDQLWKAPRVRSVALSPDGQRVVVAVAEEVPAEAKPGDKGAKVRDEDDTEWRWSIELTDLARGEVTVLTRSEFPISGLQWVGDQTLLAQLTLSRSAPPGLTVFHLPPGGKPEWMVAPRVGRVVDLVPGDDTHVLFATRSVNFRDVELHRLDVRSTGAVRDFRFLRTSRLNKGLEGDYAWYTDQRGQVRAALVAREDQVVLVHGGDGKFKDVRVIEDPDEFMPLMASADGSGVYGTSAAGRGQRDLVLLDPATNTITRTVFSREGVDVEHMLVDAAQQPVGVRYYEAGQLVSEYFDDASRDVVRLLAKAFPERTVAAVGRSRDSRRWLLWVDGSDQPPQLYHLDLDKGRALLVDEAMPWLDAAALAPSTAIEVKARDGLVLDAFVTLPRSPGPHPLVVMPHGGPIGVADRRHFDPQVQLMASLGFAVLQVNFRGSAGYGKQFEEAGHQAWGTAIEDDLDDALKVVLGRFPIDAGRMCMVGGSYGGYSALISAVRWPGRYRCVVSIAGVSDRSLTFSASDFGRDAARSPRLREMMERLLGNPRTQPEVMRETSPLFRYRELATPVMLVHGGEDLRVDYEHTRRLVRMMALAGRPPVLVELKGQAHGIAGEDDIVRTWEGVAGFLQRHLAPSPAAGGASP